MPPGSWITEPRHVSRIGITKLQYRPNTSHRIQVLFFQRVTLEDPPPSFDITMGRF